MLSHSSAQENLGGAELSFLRLIDVWRARTPEIEIVVVARTPEGLLQPELRAREIECHTIPYDSWVLTVPSTDDYEILGNERNNANAIALIRQIIVERKFDLVVTNTIVSPWAGVAAALAQVPHAWFVREFGDLDHGLTFALGREETYTDLNLLSQVVITNSETIRDHIAPWVDAGTMMVQYPDVDADSVRERSQEDWEAGREPWVFTHNPKDLRLVMLGRVAESKGQYTVIDAVTELVAAGKPVRLCLVGSILPAERARMEALLRERSLEKHVQLVGEVSNPFPYVVEADVGITASRAEAFGRGTTEYMALGLPVLASRAGANLELVEDGVTGILFDSGDAHSLAEAISAYRGKTERVMTDGRAARERFDRVLATRYPVGAVIDRLEALAVSDEVTFELPHLPHLVHHWMTLPATFRRVVSAVHLDVDPRSLPRYQVGEQIMAPIRSVQRWWRQRGGRRS
ncbi:glycosyltransferase [Klugiella xanthotipulae]|uniref:Glycosyltransferase involved in cell wall biosynthesis n=1 Tax=Klugiella xanthotipulae TaxID=244735 RepID=A0A543HYK0_9MICO|nr:glycosyltransferase [Klugiella xanthotipulae]TQM63399.1 glycosyltransferase involved in cell wall biosynthesis [Klugiella xanthotipulae]